MNDRQRRLHERRQQALGRLARDRESVAARRGSPPRPGDVFVSSATTGQGVQWTVVDRDFQRPGRLRVVAADLNPLAGSADVEIAPEAPCGALTVRCHVDLPLRESALEEEKRTGVLADEDLRRIREKRRELDQGSVRASRIRRSTDDDPAYQDWIEEVEKAAVDLLWSNRELYVPVIDAESGEYDRSPLEMAGAADRARNEVMAQGLVLLISRLVQRMGKAFLGPEGFNLEDPGQAGWGVVLASDAEPELRDALAPLVEHRRAQLGEDRVFVFDHRPGEGWRDWLARHGAAAADLVDPDKVPYYLLLVGSPSRIPFELQSVLGLQRAVGRLSFDDVEAYRRYAESVVAQETDAPPPARKAVFFAPRYRRDPVSRLHADLLVKPLMGGTGEPGVAQEAGFLTVRLWGEDATKERLAEAVRGGGNGHEATPPALLFASAHGLGWPAGHPRQGAGQGAMICQDWPGPGEPIDRSHYFSGEDLGDDARVHGTIAFLLSSYGAGTPQEDLFSRQPGEPAPRVADEPFVARLPQRLLSHPRGGALAVVGLVDRAWGHALAATAAEERLKPLRRTLSVLLQGRPVGHAVRELNRRYAILAFDLNQLLEQASYGKKIDDQEVATAWVERNHAQSYVVLGDPAVAVRGAPAV